jgi:hypothetical protein
MTDTEYVESQERPFTSMKDLSPIEHFLFGSSIEHRDKGILNSNALNERSDLRKNADFLLKPFGLTTEESDVEEIRKKREEKKQMDGWHSCFEVPNVSIDKEYYFHYVLGSPEENGMLKNEFTFQLKRQKTNEWLVNNEGDAEALAKIKLTDNLSDLFELTKNDEKGTLTLKYKPLLENTNQ